MHDSEPLPNLPLKEIAPTQETIKAIQPQLQDLANTLECVQYLIEKNGQTEFKSDQQLLAEAQQGYRNEEFAEDEDLTEKQFTKGVRLFKAWRAMVLEAEDFPTAHDQGAQVTAEFIGFSKVVETISAMAIIKPNELVELMSKDKPKNLQELNAALRNRIKKQLSANEASSVEAALKSNDSLLPQTNLDKNSPEYLAALQGDDNPDWALSSADYNDSSTGSTALFEKSNKGQERAQAVRRYEELSFAFIQPQLQEIVGKQQKVSLN